MPCLQAQDEVIKDKLLEMASAEDRLLAQRDTLVGVAGEAMRARQKAQAASDAKSGFLADMSHEFRTPLNAIIGITEIMLEDVREGGPDEMLEPLQRVLSAGGHLLHLINDVLDLSKIEAGKLQLRSSTIDPLALAREAVATAMPLAEKNDTRLTLESADGIGSINGDPTRLQQILLNLIGNACKFTKGGDVRVSVKRERVGDGSRIVCTVADTGIGMTAEQIGRLFEKYSQAGPQTAREFGGTGLGLVISRRLARLMGGDITVTSQPGQGSVFTLELPIMAPDLAGESSVPSEAPEQGYLKRAGANG